MYYPQDWHPSKFIQIATGWVGSPDPSELGIGSRLIGDILADVYFRAIRTHVRGRLLDLGCGKVPLYGMYRDLVTDSICIDWEETLHKNRHIDQFADLNSTLPIGDEEFDTVLSTDVLEHIARPGSAWAEMSRVLRPGGKLLLATPFLYWLHEEPHEARGTCSTGSEAGERRIRYYYPAEKCAQSSRSSIECGGVGQASTGSQNPASSAAPPQRPAARFSTPPPVRRLA